MKRVFTFLLISIPLFMPAQNSSGINTTFMVLSLNGGGNVFYDMQAATGNTDFNGANLGTFTLSSGNTLVIKGAESNVYKCGTCNVSGTSVLYRVWKTSSGASGSFTEVPLGYVSGFGNGCGGEDQKWDKTNGTTDISQLPNGNYTLDVYVTAQQSACGSTVHFASNSGNNYKATFTVAGSVLEVGLNSFSVKKNTNSNSVLWSTASEVNNSHFEIERSNNATTFTKIGQEATKTGTAETVKNYTFTDAIPLAGINYYRLKMVDTYGKATYSKIVSVNNTGKTAIALTPNPTKSDLTVALSSDRDGEATVRMTDLLGRLILNEKRAVNKGDNQLTVNVAHLANGTYLLNVDGMVAKFQKN